MKFNLAKAANYTGTTIDGVNYRYGWYKSGRAFIAKNGELLNFYQACGLRPKSSCFDMSGRFFVGLTSYKLTIDGIVRYLQDKYNS